MEGSREPRGVLGFHSSGMGGLSEGCSTGSREGVRKHKLYEHVWTLIHDTYLIYKSQGPHSYILMMGGGGGGLGSDRGSYVISKEIPTSGFVYLKNPYFSSIPKKIPQKR